MPGSNLGLPGDAVGSPWGSAEAAWARHPALGGPAAARGASSLSQPVKLM